MINHTPNGLVITIQTKTPEVSHELLMRALIAASSWPAETRDDVTHKKILLQLLSAMVPSDAVLEKGYAAEAAIV